jgi:hypothetical protein
MCSSRSESRRGHAVLRIPGRETASHAAQRTHTRVLSRQPKIDVAPPGLPQSKLNARRFERLLPALGDVFAVDEEHPLAFSAQERRVRRHHSPSSPDRSRRRPALLLSPCRVCGSDFSSAMRRFCHPGLIAARHSKPWTGSAETLVVLPGKPCGTRQNLRSNPVPGPFPKRGGPSEPQICARAVLPLGPSETRSFRDLPRHAAAQHLAYARSHGS